MKQVFAILFAAFMLGACSVATVEPTVDPSPSLPVVPTGDPGPGLSNPQRSFVTLVRQMEPVVERECRQRAPRLNCDFRIVVDDRPNQPPNAFQTLDENGRPILGFTESLIEDVANIDELAFVLGHEAAHHIAGHLARQQQNATLGAAIFGALASQTGAQGGSIESAQRLGAAVGARSYSKAFELEADSLGTILTARAGYDPVRGAAYFNRIPDPGNRFLGTHPPNAERIATVRRTAAGL
ncbi:M48 family metallopeptidase [Shimia ponticola]|uniref:M48 family metallopeptidase n=1 Tax=Shimia ponticola TaxID=2582893 RepID=UPI0011BEC6F0|nr:M48 family metallopeptidase [Shimia ponticola]